MSACEYAWGRAWFCQGQVRKMGAAPGSSRCVPPAFPPHRNGQRAVRRWGVRCCNLRVCEFGSQVGSSMNDALEDLLSKPADESICGRAAKTLGCAGLGNQRPQPCLFAFGRHRHRLAGQLFAAIGYFVARQSQSRSRLAELARYIELPAVHKPCSRSSSETRRLSRRSCIFWRPARIGRSNSSPIRRVSICCE